MGEDNKNRKQYTTWYVVVEGEDGFWGIYLSEKEAYEDLYRMQKKYEKWSWSKKFKVISKTK